MSNTMTTDNWIKVAQEADFATDVGGCIKHHNKHIAIFNINNRTEWYAIDNICPHKGQNVLSRGIVGDTDGEPKVACPLHKNAFLLKTGQCISDETTPGVRSYEIKCENGEIFINLTT